MYDIKIQKIMLNKTATWNDMKLQRSKMVFNATYAENIIDQAKHFVLVVVCYKALPRRSRSRQNNESTVASSCTSLEFTSYHSKGSMSWEIGRITKTQKSRRLLQKHNFGTIVERFLEDEKVSRAHARSWFHAVRHGRN